MRAMEMGLVRERLTPSVPARQPVSVPGCLISRLAGCMGPFVREHVVEGSDWGG